MTVEGSGAGGLVCVGMGIGVRDQMPRGAPSFHRLGAGRGLSFRDITSGAERRAWNSAHTIEFSVLHFMLIAIFACVVMSDQLRAITPGPPTSWTMGVLAISWGVSIALVVIQVIAGQIALQRLQRTGSYVVVNRFDRIVLGSRWAGVLMHVIATLGLGSLNATREVIGNLVLIDEFLSSAPALLVIVAGWWASYAMDRLMREAALIGSLDRSRPVWDGPTRLGHVVMQVRHQVLLVLVPVSLLTALGETSPRLIQLVARWLEPLHGAAGDVGRWLAGVEGRSLAHSAIQFAGVLALMAMLPLAIRWLWDTIPIRSGPLAEDLLGLCDRNRVPVRELLLWRTHGTMINGAVIGVFGRARHILLTDALIDDLPIEQVRAVLAHELGHVRNKHIVWLGLCLISTMLVFTVALSLVIWFAIQSAGIEISIGDEPSAIEFAGGGLAIVGAFVVFGWVSRRFEWQADAFAVAALSRDEHVADSQRPISEQTARGVITTSAARAMAGALDSVATLNHIPRRRFAFRHGSIDRRIRNILSLEGRRLDALPIDRTARWIKWCVLAMSALALAALVFDTIINRAPV